MPKFQPPEYFNFERPGDWKEWRARFERYAIINKLSEDSDDIQVNTLVYSIGPKAETVYSAFKWTEGETVTLVNTLKKFEEYFTPQRNVIHERAQFHMRNQKPAETVENYVRALYDQAAKCDFKDDQRDTHIRDRLVVGLSDITLSEKLQLKNDLKLEDAIVMARQHETLQDQLKEQKHQGGAVSEIRSSHSSRRGTYRGRSRGHGRSHVQSKPPSQESQGQGTCGKCGNNHDLGYCPAKKIRCNKCNAMGHFASVCRTDMSKRRGRGRNRHVREVAVPDELQETSFFLGTITNDTVVDRPWEVTLRLCGSPTVFKIDTGADVTVITSNTYNSLKNVPPLQDVNLRLQSVGGRLDCLGMFQAKIWPKKSKQVYLVNVYVVEGGTSNLLSRIASTAMGYVSLTLNETTTVSEMPYGEIGLMNCKPVKIKLKADAEPYSINTARRVPLPLLGKIKEELQRMEQHGVIIPVTEPTEWCSPMVPVQKPNGKIRICVDLKRLNQNVVREKFILPTLDEILPKLSGAQVFSSLDAASGFWAIPLDPGSAKLTTFITPFGRFCFQRLPFGITSAPEIFQKIMSELLHDMDGVALYMDDILIYGKSQKQHDDTLRAVLTKIKNSGLKLNKSKCTFSKTALDFLGHHIDANGIKPSLSKLEAIAKLESPSNLTELRRCLGMFHYLSRYIKDLATLMKPLNDLLKKDALWAWGASQEEAFSKAKECVTSAPNLAYFDLKKPTVVSVDASSYGLGACLMQQQGTDETDLRPVAYASRTLTGAESRYAQIEKECLATVWGCEKFAQYLSGMGTFTLQTDHKPLVPLIMCKDLDQVPLRCQRLLMRLMRFNPNAIHVPGKDLVIADTLSRSPMQSSAVDEHFANEVEIHIAAVMMYASTDTLTEIKEATAEDKLLQEVIQYTLDGWPLYKKDIPSYLQRYHEIRAHLTVMDGLLLYDHRIFIPDALKRKILTKIHEGHQGVGKCRARAQGTIFWLGISQDIKDYIEQCSLCQRHRNQQHHESLQPTPLPSRPWERVGADMLEHNGKHYLLVTDYYSRFFELLHLTRTTSQDVVYACKSIFARWGIPNMVISDNGPQFASQVFTGFSQEYGFSHTTSSPHYPQANGAAERFVQTAKNILDQPDPFLGLMAHRSTECATTGYSPAQLIMGRQIRTTLPALDRHYTPSWPRHQSVKNNDDRAKASHKYYYDQRHGVRDLPPVTTSQKVLVRTDQDKSWSTPGTVVKPADTPRSVILQTDQGGVLRRNRRHLLSIPEPARSPAGDREETPTVVDVGKSPAISKSPRPNIVKSPTTPQAPRRSNRAMKPVNRLDL